MATGKISLSELAGKSTDQVLAELATGERGLTLSQVKERLALYGFNQIAAQKKLSPWARLGGNLKDPLSVLLFVLGLVAYLTGDYRSTVLIVVMLLLSVFLRWFQELKGDQAAEELENMVCTTVTVTRQGTVREVPLKGLVPGDIIHLSAGDLVPADARLLEAKDLFINQATLTGESISVEKHASPVTVNLGSEMQAVNLCFMGTNVESGTALAVAINTGVNTYFGQLAKQASGDKDSTSFDKGVSRFTWLMIKLIGVMVPLVFLINGWSKGNWLEAFLFALAVAVGLTPELLPMIVTVNLSKGALLMSKRKVIVKRLKAIQNFGAMDILCTDKTGTLTEGKVKLIRHWDINGQTSQQILDYAYLNSYYQTGLKNLLDKAVLEHPERQPEAWLKKFSKVDEVPFDFTRRRMSVVVHESNGSTYLICKGAVEEILSCVSQVVVDGKITPWQSAHHTRQGDLVESLSAEGFRVVALAYRQVPVTQQVFTVADEADLTLLGFLAFLDPVKETVGRTIKELKNYGVNVKILTGDNELVTRKVCSEVGLYVDKILLGHEIEAMTDEDLALAAEQAEVFDKLAPAHKERIIRVLRSQGHVVGFMGDGINDAPALRVADVGISVDSAVDVAKESSDIILLEKSLMVLRDGVREGRKVFGNIVKYIRMAASSNFGNMFSVLGASIFLPFLPMLPLQVIANNLLYDFSQVTIPSDDVDEEYLTKPRRWQLVNIRRFIMVLGPVSSLFDYITYGVLIWFFGGWTNPALFQTGWFVESLFTQTLVIHFIRSSRLPFIKTHASWLLLSSTILVVMVGAWLPFSSFSAALGFVPLPGLYWWWLAAILLSYFSLAYLVKVWFSRQYGEE